MQNAPVFGTDSYVTLSYKTSSGSLAATASGTLARAGKCPFCCANILYEALAPSVPAVSAIAEVDKLCPEVNRTSPSTIPTELLRWNVFEAELFYLTYNATFIKESTPLFPPQLVLSESTVKFIASAVPPSIAILNQYEPPAVRDVSVEEDIPDKPKF